MKLFNKYIISFVTILSFSLGNSKIVFSQIPPYGDKVNQYNSEAFSAIQKGDYDTAIINYQRAVDAAQKLSEPTLRDCGVAGAMANLRGAETAKGYLKENGINPRTLAQAEEIYQVEFRNYWHEFDRQRPDLVNSCP